MEGEEVEVEVEERMEIQGLYGGMGDDELWEEEYNSYRAIPENPPEEKKMKMVQDAVVSQHHQRMIKNRESAARSRERKQAYNLELEGMIKILKDENEQLKRQEVEDTKKRLKQLLETLIPVEEMSRPPRHLRKTQGTITRQIWKQSLSYGCCLLTFWSNDLEEWDEGQNHMRHKEKPISSDRLGKQKGRGVRRRYPARRRKRIE
ncbi:hypothetical protein AAC387_Pa08g0804 [Persea americana]